MLDPDLRAILVCPADHHPLDDEPGALRCPQCGRRYPIEDGIPVMLAESPPTSEPGTPET